MEISSLIVKGSFPDTTHQRLAVQSGDRELTFVKGMGVFFDKAGAHVPQVYEHFVLKFEAQMDMVVFMHMRFVPIPYVAPEDMYRVSRTSVRNIYRLAIRHGYNDRVVTPDLGRLVYEEIRRAILAGVVRPAGGAATAAAQGNNVHWPSEDESEEINNADTIAAKVSSADINARPQPRAHDPEKYGQNVDVRIRALDEAYATQTLFLVGKEQLRISPGTDIVRRFLLGAWLFIRENTRQKVQQLDVPVEKLVEVGFVGYI